MRRSAESGLVLRMCFSSSAASAVSPDVSSERNSKKLCGQVGDKPVGGWQHLKGFAALLVLWVHGGKQTQRSHGKVAAVFEDRIRLAGADCVLLGEDERFQLRAEEIGIGCGVLGVA